MQVKYFGRVFNEATAAAESDPIYNMYANCLGIQVDGTFTSLTLNVLGKTTKEGGAFSELGVINLSTFDIAAAIDAKGLYEVPVEGICVIKFEIAAIAGGNVTVDARLVSTGV